MSVLPIGLRGEALTVLVVGGGRVGSRKARAFLDAGSRVRVVAPIVDPSLSGDANPSLEIAQREFRDTDLEGVDIAVVATDDSDVNAHVAHLSRERRTLCNRADEPADGTFETLAVHRAGSLAIGVSAGGAPAAAALIRDEIASRFDSRYGDAVSKLAALRSDLRGTDGWSRLSAALSASDFCAEVESGTLLDRIAQWD